MHRELRSLKYVSSTYFSPEAPTLDNSVDIDAG